jgi:cell division septal protein FtsQ
MAVKLMLDATKPPARRKRKPAPVRRRVYARTATDVMWLGPDLAVSILSAPRVASGLILLFCIMGLTCAALADQFYVYRPTVSGNQYVDAREVIKASGIEGMHIAWINPGAAMEAIVAQLPNVEAAYIDCTLPAACVITVEERQPVFVWRSGDLRVWVDRDGAIISARGLVADLPSVEMLTDAVPVPGQYVERSVVEGVQALERILPDLKQLHYTAEHGLEFSDPVCHCPVYLGSGAGMESRVAVWQALSRDLAQRGIAPTFIDVRYAQAPYYATH